MNKLFAIIFLTLPCSFQAQEVTMLSLDEALQMPADSVYGLDLSKQKLQDIPSEVFQFTQLKALNLSKNKLADVRDELRELKQLEWLNLGKNRLTTFPVEICALSNLKHLMVNENPIQQVPECFGFLINLETVDFFQLRLKSLPDGLKSLPKLKQLDVRGMLFLEKTQQYWTDSLPNCKLLFDASCNCLEGN